MHRNLNTQAGAERDSAANQEIALGIMKPPTDENLPSFSTLSEGIHERANRKGPTYLRSRGQPFHWPLILLPN